MKMQKRHYIVAIAIALIVVNVGVLYSLESKDTESILAENGKEAFDLMAHWGEGNVVALVRHAERCDKSENECLDEDKGITVAGKDMSTKLGNDFRALLNLEDTMIYNSPVKRASQTAEYMFGESSNDAQWLFGGHDCRVNLLNEIFRHKEDGKNMILITHSECINELSFPGMAKLINFDEKDKRTYDLTTFLAIDKHGKRAHVLGDLSPEDWEKAISQKRARID